MRSFRFVLAVAVIAVFALVGGSWAVGSEKINIVGSTTVLPIAQACAERFMDLHPEIDVFVKGGGSGVGISALIDGTCDIADASRPMKPSEVIRAKAKGINPVAHVIAKDGIAVVIHSSNPVSALTIDQIKDIYVGRIRNWKELGGKDMKIIVISRDSSSGTYEVFEHLVLKGTKIRKDALLMASNKAVAMAVAKTPGAIGYVGLGYLSKSLKALKVDGVYPTLKTVIDGSYKLSRPLFMYTNGRPTGAVKEFIDFVLSPEGQRIVKEQGFVPIGLKD
ncbi:MAG: phosphate ABC transporter substrate-binding protein [Synergistetes bacterium]|nr:phosphate ABC transporter substrate-binding protein [Synergistota bacterium]